MAIAMAMIAHTRALEAEGEAASTVVAGPVRADSAISRTGLRSVEVKCSVIRLAASERPTPVSTAQKTLRLWT